MLLLDGTPRAAQALPAAQPDPPDVPPAEGPPERGFCRHCRRRIPWHEPLDEVGWKVIHRCPTWTVEAYAGAAGEPPWQWRTSKGP